MQYDKNTFVKFYLADHSDVKVVT